MQIITNDSKLTKGNLLTAMRQALRDLNEVTIEVQAQAPWQCPDCVCAFAWFTHTGEISDCASCGAVPGLGPVRVRSKWRRIVVRHKDNVVLVARSLERAF